MPGQRQRQGVTRDGQHQQRGQESAGSQPATLSFSRLDLSLVLVISIRGIGRDAARCGSAGIEAILLRPWLSTGGKAAREAILGRPGICERHSSAPGMRAVS